MAVAISGTSLGTDPAVGASTMTWSHTAPAGSDTLLLVGVAWHSAVSTRATATFNAVSLTERTYCNSANEYVSLLGLLVPTSGAHNIVVTFPTNVTALGFGISFTGVDQVAPYYDTQTLLTPTPTSPQNIPISTYTGSYAVDVGYAVGGNTGVIQNGATSLMNAADALTAFGQFMGGRLLDATQLGWAWSGTASNLLQVAVSVRPAGVAVGSGGAIFGSRLFGG